MKKFFRLDDFGAGCFGLIALMIIIPSVIWLLV